MRVMCTECGQLGRITKTNRMTAGVANLYCQCTDASCGHSWVSTLAYSHTLSPSAKRASDMAMNLARGLSPEAHGSLCESVNERQQQLRDKAQRMKIADLPFVSHQHMPGTYLAITLVENLQVLTVNRTHRLNAGEIDDLASWGIRYNRAQSYALGIPTAYAAFDAITIATQE